MSELKCGCDPLYMFVERILEEALSKAVLEESDSQDYCERSRGAPRCITAHHRPISHDEDVSAVRDKKEHDLETCSESRAKNLLLLTNKFRERCIRSYSGSICRNSTSKETISLAFTRRFFMDLPNLGRSELELNEEKILAQMDYDAWFPNRESPSTELGIESVNIPENKYNSVYVNVYPSSIAQAVIPWILHNYPRSTVSSSCCRVEHSWVSLGATDLPESHGKMPIVQYRKFLAAKLIISSLGKSGYFVNPDKFHILPQESLLDRSVFLMTKGRNGLKTVQRLNVGLVAVKKESSSGTEIFREMTAEHFHNLRLQGMKHMREDSNLEDRMDSEVNLSWIISAANLTIATMNYDLLLKDLASDIELLASERKTSLNNNGMLLIMYNYARIVSILKKFSDMVIQGDYPPLPPLQSMDFELLGAEEMDLIRLIWEWPRIVERTVNFLDHSFNISSLLKGIKELATSFNTFYRSSMVLGQPSAPHNFNKMYVRIYLLHACRQVFEEFLEIMQIDFHVDIQMQSTLQEKIQSLNVNH